MNFKYPKLLFMIINHRFTVLIKLNFTIENAEYSERLLCMNLESKVLQTTQNNYLKKKFLHRSQVFGDIKTLFV